MGSNLYFFSFLLLCLSSLCKLVGALQDLNPFPLHQSFSGFRCAEPNQTVVVKSDYPQFKLNSRVTAGDERRNRLAGRGSPVNRPRQRYRGDKSGQRTWVPEVPRSARSGRQLDWSLPHCWWAICSFIAAWDHVSVSLGGLGRWGGVLPHVVVVHMGGPGRCGGVRL